MTVHSRDDWDGLVAAFAAFFEGCGSVSVSPDEVVFEAPDPATGLRLARDGTSRSFMPLHDLAATWDEVAFDVAAGEVRLSGAGSIYTYRIPPKLTTRAPVDPE